MSDAVAVSGVDWDQLQQLAQSLLADKCLPAIYAERLRFELNQIDNQGTNTYWVNLYNDGKRFASNPNRLLLPWLLGMVQEDPIAVLDQQRDGPLLTTSDYRAVADVIAGTGRLPVDIYQDSDKPDIDLDCLPEAREPIKQYAQSKYGVGLDDSDEAHHYGFVCSVGTWQTYLIRQAIIDVYKHTGCGTKDSILSITTQLPDEVDEMKEGGRASCKNRINVNGEEKECGTVHDQVYCPKCESDATDTPTIARLLQDYQVLREFKDRHPQVLDLAVGLVGRIKTMGKHAGALIIADRPLYGNIPLAMKSGKDKFTGERLTHWISMWSEGRNTQLSKFGYNKWDILGLKNLKYIYTCCKLVEHNQGVRFGDRLEGWDDVDPEQNRAGWCERLDRETGQWVRQDIPLNDPEALRLANELKTDAVFQFDTDLAKRILSNGVSNFDDLMLLNACGHPGPMDSIPEAMQNRADTTDVWRQKLKQLDPVIYDVLKDTYGIIVYQEQLAAIWQGVAGFTSPEAQDARKAVAKKWRHLLKPVESKWMQGAIKKLGEAVAREWWQKQVTFGRYAFNKCLCEDVPLRDATTGEIKSIGDWYRSSPPSTIDGWDGNKRVVDDCVAIHDTGAQEVFEVEFDNGCKERVTLQHRFLCYDGQFHTVAEIIELNLDVVNSDAQPET